MEPFLSRDRSYPRARPGPILQYRPYRQRGLVHPSVATKTYGNVKKRAAEGDSPADGGRPGRNRWLPSLLDRTRLLPSSQQSRDSPFLVGHNTTREALIRRWSRSRTGQKLRPGQALKGLDFCLEGPQVVSIWDPTEPARRLSWICWKGSASLARGHSALRRAFVDRGLPPAAGGGGVAEEFLAGGNGGGVCRTLRRHLRRRPRSRQILGGAALRRERASGKPVGENPGDSSSPPPRCISQSCSSWTSLRPISTQPVNGNSSSFCGR